MKSKRHRVLAVGLGGVLALGVGSVLALMEAPGDSNVPPRDAELDAPRRAAVERGVQFLEASVPTELDHVYLHSVAVNRFDVGRFEAVDRGLLAMTQHSAERGRLVALLPMTRLVDESVTLPDSFELPFTEEPINALTIAAIHCTTRPPDAALVATVNRLASFGDYAATHVALAYFFSRSLGCPGVVTDEVFRDVLRAAAQIVIQANSAHDLAIEAALVLEIADCGSHSSVAGSLTTLEALVLEAQQPNGGWRVDPSSSTVAEAHPTGLAVWWLLERHATPLGPVLPGGTSPRWSCPL